MTATNTTSEHIRDYLDQYRTRQLPSSWFPTGWTGPRSGNAVIAHLAHDPDSDQLAWHLDHLYEIDPATRDLLVAASAQARHQPVDCRGVGDDLIVELYIDYGEHHGALGPRAVCRARWRAFNRVHSRRVDAHAQPIDPRPGEPGELVLGAFRRRVGAADNAGMTTGEADIELAEFIARFRTKVLAYQPQNWPKIQALLIAEFTGTRTVHHPPPGRSMRTRRAVAPIARGLLAS